MQGLKEAALELSLQDRRDLSLALLFSLPRDDVIALNETISQSLQKDIIGCLPEEIAIHVLAYLDLQDILRCTEVSSKWAKLCRDQGLWASLCLSHAPRIRARDTIWADVHSHAQLMHLNDSYVQSDKDEGQFESGFEDLSFHTDVGGVEIPPSPGSATLGSSTMSMRGGMRGLVWERSGSGLPTHVASPSSRGNTPRKSRFAEPDVGGGMDVEPFRKTPDCPLSSHLKEPTAQPSVDYKHLYISHAILSRRLRAGQGIPKLMPGSGQTARQPQLVRPRVIDAISSIEAGGLPGHAETIYALQLVARRMTIKLVQPGQDGMPSRPRTPTPFDQSALTPQKDRVRASTVTGRDWLLSSSRDHTLRLWHLSCPRPHVVKMFTEGHIGSVLCLAVVEVAIKEKDTTEQQVPSVSPRFRTRRKSLKANKTRLVAVSGGSDGRLCLWDVEHGDGRPEVISEEHTDAILCVKADETRIVTSSKDRTIRVHDVQTLEQLLIIDCMQEGLHRGAINSVCLTKDYIISASGDKTIRVWCIHTGAQFAEIEAGDRGIASMDFSPAPPGSALQGTIVAGSSDASIKVFHLVAVVRQQENGVDLVDALDMIPPRRDMTLREMLEHEDTNEFDMSASVGSAWETNSVATASTTRISLDRDDQHQDQDHGNDHDHARSNAFYDHDNNDNDNDNDNDNSSFRHRPSLPLEELRIEPASRCWAACNCPPGMNKSDSALCRRCCNRGHTDLVRSVCFGESVVLSGSYDSTVKVWDRSSGQLLANLSGVHSGRIFSVVGDRMRIVSSGLDSRISIWDFAEGIDTSFVEP